MTDLQRLELRMGDLRKQRRNGDEAPIGVGGCPPAYAPPTVPPLTPPP